MSSSTAKPRSKLLRSVSNQPTQPIGQAERLSAAAREAWAGERRNTLAEPPLPWTNGNRSSQNQCCQQLADRIHELQQEIRGDVHPCRIPSLFSPFSPVTPASNLSAGGGFSIFPHSRSFSINLPSPHASIPTQRYSLSSKMLEQAHRIPERCVSSSDLMICIKLPSRFWMDWQEKQKQHRLGELEAMRNTLSSPVYSFRRPNDPNSSTLNRRKSLRLLHNAQQHRSTLRPMMSIDDPPSPPRSLDTLEQSIPSSSWTRHFQKFVFSEPVPAKSPATLDRTRLSIALPYSLNTTQPPAETSPRPYPPDAILIREPSLEYHVSPSSSLDDVAEIDTELNVTFLSQEKPSESNLVLYSKALIRRSVAFRSLSPRTRVDDQSISWNLSLLVYSGLRSVVIFRKKLSVSSEALSRHRLVLHDRLNKVWVNRRREGEHNHSPRRVRAGGVLIFFSFSLSLDPAPFCWQAQKQERKRESKHRWLFQRKKTTGIDSPRKHTSITFNIFLSLARCPENCIKAMIDEHSLRHDPLTANPTMRKNGHVRIFVRRRPACGVGHRVRSTDMERLTSLVERTLIQKRKRSRQRKSIIVINYKPVFMNTRPRKTKSVPPKAPAPETKPEPQPVPKQPGAPYDLPEVEDPFMFIEEMYQQLFNDDGQLRQGTEPKALANCMKHIVATSRRNSMARRESVSSPVRQRKASIPSSSYYSQFKANQPPSVSSSSHVLSNTFSEEEENEADTLVHTNPSLR